MQENKFIRTLKSFGRTVASLFTFGKKDTGKLFYSFRFFGLQFYFKIQEFHSFWIYEQIGVLLR